MLNALASAETNTSITEVRGTRQLTSMDTQTGKLMAGFMSIMYPAKCAELKVSLNINKRASALHQNKSK